MPYRLAPDLIVSEWLNSDRPQTLSQHRGKVILIEVFQMLCPACVQHALPQASEVLDSFSSDQLIVLGLHSVFEHHAAMSPETLSAFLHEYRIRFPVAIDAPSPDSPLPQTMQRYQLQGTPSQILVDRCGQLRKVHFGTTPDLKLGAELMSLLNEPFSTAENRSNRKQHETAACDSHGCKVR